MKLVMVNEAGDECCREVRNEEVLGRSRGSTIRLDDPAVSGEHCAIFTENRLDAIER
jgi:hypothetical protein